MITEFWWGNALESPLGRPRSRWESDVIS